MLPDKYWLANISNDSILYAIIVLSCNQFYCNSIIVLFYDRVSNINSEIISLEVIQCKQHINYACLIAFQCTDIDIISHWYVIMLLYGLVATSSVLQPSVRTSKSVCVMASCFRMSRSSLSLFIVLTFSHFQVFPSLMLSSIYKLI